MRILVLEDDYRAFDVVVYLENKGHEVTLAYSLADLQFYLKVDPGIAYYDAFLIDANIPGEKIASIMDIPEITYEDPYDMNGCVYLLENRNMFQKYEHKIALRTAYGLTIDHWLELQESEEDRAFISRLPRIDKAKTGGSLDDLMDFLGEVKTRKSDIG